MLSGGCKSPLGTPLLLFLLPGRQPAPAQALQPAGWVLLTLAPAASTVVKKGSSSCFFLHLEDWIRCLPAWAMANYGGRREC